MFLFKSSPKASADTRLPENNDPQLIDAVVSDDGSYAPESEGHEVLSQQSDNDTSEDDPTDPLSIPNIIEVLRIAVTRERMEKRRQRRRMRGEIVRLRTENERLKADHEGMRETMRALQTENAARRKARKEERSILANMHLEQEALKAEIVPLSEEREALLKGGLSPEAMFKLGEVTSKLAPLYAGLEELLLRTERDLTRLGGGITGDPFVRDIVRPEWQTAAGGDWGWDQAKLDLAREPAIHVGAAGGEITTITPEDLGAGEDMYDQVAGVLSQLIEQEVSALSQLDPKDHLSLIYSTFQAMSRTISGGDSYNAALQFARHGAEDTHEDTLLQPCPVTAGECGVSTTVFPEFIVVEVVSFFKELRLCHDDQEVLRYFKTKATTTLRLGAEPRVQVFVQPSEDSFAETPAAKRSEVKTLIETGSSVLETLEKERQSIGLPLPPRPGEMSGCSLSKWRDLWDYDVVVVHDSGPTQAFAEALVWALATHTLCVKLLNANESGDTPERHDDLLCCRTAVVAVSDTLINAPAAAPVLSVLVERHARDPDMSVVLPVMCGDVSGEGFAQAHGVPAVDTPDPLHGKQGAVVELITKRILEVLDSERHPP